MNHSEKLTNAIDFLMWSYFNLTVADGNNLNNKILERCIKIAYLDATQQGAYNTSLNSDDMKNASKSAKDNAEKELRNQINEYLTDTSMDFNEWHKNTCKEIQKIYAKVNNDTERFSYGNAQKWVNMTLKYVYLLYQLYDEFSHGCNFCKQYKPLIESHSSSFHIPVDSFIIDVLWKDMEIKLPYRKKEYETKRCKKYAHPSDYVKPWSQWSKQDYKKFQESVHKSSNTDLKCSQLDWEGSKWIAEAQKRKNEKTKGEK